MNKSDESDKQSEEGTNNEDNHQEENEPQNTNDLLLTPDKIAHNMIDLKTWDFNSADEVRQTMKAVFEVKVPDTNEPKEPKIVLPKDDDRKVSSIKPPVVQLRKTKFTETDNVKLQRRSSNTLKMKATRLRFTKTYDIDPSRKRPGRPPKAGPSKRMKKQNSSKIFTGKLSNVVFSREYDFDSESDVDSVYGY